VPAKAAAVVEDRTRDEDRVHEIEAAVQEELPAGQ
jgi:hypothetical protein